RLGAGHRVALGRRRLRSLVRGARRADVVGAIVTHDDPSEAVDRPARYRLTVNGMLQPGG
ncbi:MAG: hypothetical protein M3P39_07260, partial [Actinomycetota bacterium]|nr:hypothetical protein [Actinomycetota bacterium]